MNFKTVRPKSVIDIFIVSNKKVCGYYLQFGDSTRLTSFPAQSGESSVRSEMVVLIKALRLVKNKYWPILIHTESAFLQKSIAHHWYKTWERNNWRTKKGTLKNPELWTLLSKELNQFNDVDIINGVPNKYSVIIEERTR